MKTIILLLFAILSIGCTSVIIKEHEPFPAEPTWSEYTRQPVIRSIKVDNQQNYEISDELLKRTLQMNNYIQRIDKWKTKNVTNHNL